MKPWYEIEDVKKIETPALVFFKSRIIENIERIIDWVEGDTQRLRPHIKTHKSKDILELYKKKGILKVKTSTLAETELAAVAGISDILLAYQIHHRKIERFLTLQSQFSATRFATIIDNLESATALNEAAKKERANVAIFIDVNVGMNRTGIHYQANLDGFLNELQNFEFLNVKGFHCYDGHLKGIDSELRTKDCGEYLQVLQDIVASQADKKLTIIAGGSNTFPFYAKKTAVDCSPGTFVLWDDNYAQNLPEQEFKQAAIIVAQVVSIPEKNHICIDICYKAVTSENVLEKRLRIFNH